MSTGWLQLQTDYSLPGSRERWLGRLHCGDCGATWVLHSSFAFDDPALHARLPGFTEILPDKRNTISLEQYRTWLARTCEVLPSIGHAVGPGFGLGMFVEARVRRGRPTRTEPVEWAPLFDGVLLQPSVVSAVARSGLVASADLVRVRLLPEREEGYRELRFPFAGSLPRDSYANAGEACLACGRRSPGPRWDGAVTLRGVADHVAQVRLPDFPTVFLVRQDLAEILSGMAPSIAFRPVQVVADEPPPSGDVNT